MNVLTEEWISKAEGDFATSGRELRARNHPNYDAACFHSQQMAEKYLKAVLQEDGKPVPRIHNLVELLGLCLLMHPTWEMLRSELMLLDQYAVRFRYPGEEADRIEAGAALKAATVIRRFLRQYFGLG
ncbi:MAG: HEPN domain-containing protein [Herpetosiphonaceae bacterium]|nr:HEPN domain-containing protein [Herpetosiphonaceae bacterium]